MNNFKFGENANVIYLSEPELKVFLSLVSYLDLYLNYDTNERFHYKSNVMSS